MSTDEFTIDFVSPALVNLRRSFFLNRDMAFLTPMCLFSETSLEDELLSHRRVCKQRSNVIQRKFNAVDTKGGSVRNCEIRCSLGSNYEDDGR